MCSLQANVFPYCDKNQEIARYRQVTTCCNNHPNPNASIVPSLKMLIRKCLRSGLDHLIGVRQNLVSVYLNGTESALTHLYKRQEA